MKETVDDVSPPEGDKAYIISKVILDNMYLSGNHFYTDRYTIAL